MEKQARISRSYILPVCINSAGGTKELYFSNGGTLNLDTNKVTSEGGLTKRFADEMGMQPNLLEEFKLPSIKVETGFQYRSRSNDKPAYA